jgi:hypothetical protein
LRIWAIETAHDNSGNERFNNIQLTYRLDYQKAHALVEQADTPTREDFSALAHESVDRLESIVVSDAAGKDSASGELLGTRYGFESDELNSLTDSASAELIAAISTVAERLKSSAASQ